MADSLTSYLATHLQKQVLKYAVQRAIFCHCGAILDVRRAVLAEGRDGTRVAGRVAVQCGACFDKWARKATAEDLATLEITDPRPVARQGWREYVAPPAVTRAELETLGQTRLEFGS